LGQEDSEHFERESSPEFRETLNHPSPNPFKKNISRDTDFARESELENENMKQE